MYTIGSSVKICCNNEQRFSKFDKRVLLFDIATIASLLIIVAVSSKVQLSQKQITLLSGAAAGILVSDMILLGYRTSQRVRREVEESSKSDSYLLIKESCQNSTDCTNLQLKITHLESTVSSLTRQLQENQQALAEPNTLFREKSRELQELKGIMQEKEDRLTRAEGESERCQNAIQALEQQLRETKKELSLEKERGRRDSVEYGLVLEEQEKELDKTLDEKEQKIVELEKAVESLQNSNRSYKQQIEKLSAQHQSREAVYVQTLVERSNHVEALQQQIAPLQAQNEALKIEISQVKGVLTLSRHNYEEEVQKISYKLQLEKLQHKKALNELQDQNQQAIKKLIETRTRKMQVQA